MSNEVGMTRRVVLEGGNADGWIFDLTPGPNETFAKAFSMKFQGDNYRTCGEFDKDGREIMVYDG